MFVRVLLLLRLRLTIHVRLVGAAILLIMGISMLLLLLLLASVVIILAASIIEHGSVGAIAMLVRHLIRIVLSILRILLAVSSWITIRVTTMAALAAHVLRVLVLMTGDVGCWGVLTAALGIDLTIALLSSCSRILTLSLLA